MKTVLFHRMLPNVIATFMFCLSFVPVYGQNDPSKEIMVYFSAGVERTSENLPAIVTSQTIKNVLEYFNISEGNLISAFPNFNEADTLILTPEGRWIGLANMAKIFKIIVPIGISRETVIDSLKKLTEVLFAEPNGVANPQVIPNDQYFSNQWALQPGGGTGKIQAPEAQIILSASSTVVLMEHIRI